MDDMYEELAKFECFTDIVSEIIMQFINDMRDDFDGESLSHNEDIEVKDSDYWQMYKYFKSINGDLDWFLQDQIMQGVKFEIHIAC